jgi:hypothetical protein
MCHAPMGAVQDDVSSAYSEQFANGMRSADGVQNAEQFVRRIMAGGNFRVRMLALSSSAPRRVVDGDDRCVQRRLLHPTKIIALNGTVF